MFGVKKKLTTLLFISIGLLFGIFVLASSLNGSQLHLGDQQESGKQGNNYQRLKREIKPHTNEALSPKSELLQLPGRTIKPFTFPSVDISDRLTTLSPIGTEPPTPKKSLAGQLADFLSKKYHIPLSEKKRIKRTWRNSGIPPTGPDSYTGPGESIKTSQQVTITIPKGQKICFTSHGVPFPSSSRPPTGDYQCYPTDGLVNQPYTAGIKMFPGGDIQVRFPQGGNGKGVIPNQPIHVPTAISSPNPFYFPTLGGSPVINLPIGNNFQNNHQQMGYNNLQGPFQNMPFYYNQQQGFAGQQGNVYCLTIPIPFGAQQQTIKFPTVYGVMENIQRSLDGNGTLGERNAVPDPPHGIKYPNLSEKRTQGNCPHKSLSCKDGACIPEEKWCDNEVDCEDVSDEMECSCLERVGQEKICDGVLDCPQGEDELNCPPCGKELYSCKNKKRIKRGSKCVLKEQQCNSVPDCPDGDDETECSVLKPFVQHTKGTVLPEDEGVLHQNLHGALYPICVYPPYSKQVVTQMAQQACVLEHGEDSYK